jgi:hypothetical protein
MSPVPVAIQPFAYDVGGSSMMVEIPRSTTVATKLVLTSCPTPPLVADLLAGLSKGIPLDRPADMVSLAEEVLARPAGYPENWAGTLAADVARLDD